MRVEPAHLANQFKDAMLPPVLATPMMILMMENAALNAIRPYLDPGESAVGTAINIRHLAATPV
ncbi:MAG TPA: thioesterase, partial [Bradyrhizobium sp.]|nr:thioesterase [Bradyrhizobium sp.]